MAGQMPIQPLTSLATERNRANPIDTLRRMVGLGAVDPADPNAGSGYGDPTGSLQLSQLRGSRETELENRIANDQFGRQPDPNTGRDVALLRFLKGDQAADPYTGTAATARTHHMQDELDAIAAFNRPEQTGMRREKQADAEHLATAVPRVTGEYSLRRQAIESQGNLDKQGLENTGALERQRVASQGVVDAAHSKGGPGKMAPSVMLKFAESASVVEGLDRLLAMKPDVTIGPVAGRLQGLLSHVPIIPTDEKFAAFRAETANIKNALLHTLSGAAVTPAEEVRLLAMIPLESDKDEMWTAKVTQLRKSMRGFNARLALLNQGVPAEIVMKMSLDDLADQPAGPPGGGADPDPAAPVDDGFRIR